MAYCQCDSCAYNDYDEEYEEYYCSINMDEDEIEKYLSGSTDCHYYTPYDEYKVVRKQN
ncbi:MAG: DUF6472 family protein [Acutalibacteraceae bacterium]